MGELSITLHNKGLVTALPHDKIPDGAYPNFLNMTAFKAGYIENRQGSTIVFILAPCPAVQPVLGAFYSYDFTTLINLGSPIHSQGRMHVTSGPTPTSGVPPLTWVLISGVLPAGLTLNAATGEISGIPEESGTFPYTLQWTDSSVPPKTGQLSCEFVIASEGDFLADIMYADSSPRESDLASRTFWILDGRNQIMYRSRREHPNSGAFGVWETMAIPAGQWLVLAGNANSNVALTGCFGIDARIMTKSLPTSAGDTTDYPWVAYDIPSPMHGGVPVMFAQDSVMWTPTPSPLNPPIAAINDVNIFCDGQSTVDTTFDLWGGSTSTPPAGTWNKLFGKINNVLGNTRRALAVGVGTTFLRYYDSGYGDTDWTPFPCPDGDWRDITVGPGDDYAFCVGVGAGAACANAVYPFEELTAFTMPTGWIGVTPRVVFDVNMYNVDMGGGSDGTYIIVGGEIAGVSVVVMVPIADGGETLLTPIVGTLPGGVPSDAKWRAIATNQVFEGVLIVGDSASEGILILSNPETTNAGTPATYDDWTLKTLAEAPF